MGYSISAERHDKLEKNRREDRLCMGAMSTRGCCANRATVREFCDFWNYAEEKDAGEPPLRPHALDKGMTLCRRHTFGVGFEGANFAVVRSEAY